MDGHELLVLLAEDLLAVVFEDLGLRHLLVAAATCTAWHKIASQTQEGWRILTVRGVFGSGGTAPGQFNRPTCMVALPSGLCLTADTFNHRLILHDCERVHQMLGVEVRQVQGPFFHVTPSRRTCRAALSCEQSQPSIDPCPCVNPQGHGPGELQFPRGLACDGSHIYVVETGNCRLQKLTLDGLPVLSTGCYGHDPGMVDRIEKFCLW